MLTMIRANDQRINMKNHRTKEKSKKERGRKNVYKRQIRKSSPMNTKYDHSLHKKKDEQTV